jgi:LmbE family N-acetylglucosaminyl deacetylase
MSQRIIRTTLALIFLALVITAPRAQQTTAPPTFKAPPENRAELYQVLLDLTNPWTVMCIAAHPDDEDGTSLIVMRRKYGAHTVSLFSTFGEGGQNAIGPELYEELGAIRARETMAAAEIQGSEPYFLGLNDFGYSKSGDETFKKWGHDLALSWMVLQIRKLRPNVIITNHSVTNNDHGHHQATARLELEAFDAAADPTRFPEQLKDGVTTWQVQRLFVRVRGNQGQKPDREGGREEIVTIDPNEHDPVRGVIYAEEGLRALQKHATQGPWPKTVAELAARFRSSNAESSGQLPLIRYRLEREATGVAPLLADSHNFLDGLRMPDEVTTLLASLNLDGRPLKEFVDQRDRVLTALIDIRKTDEFMRLFREQSTAPAKCLRPLSTAAADVSVALDLLWERVNAGLKEAGGIKASLASQDGGLIVGGRLEPFALHVSNQGSKPVRLEEVAFNYCMPPQRAAGGPVIAKVLNPGHSTTVAMPSLEWIDGLLNKEIGLNSDVKAPINFQSQAITLEVLVDGLHLSLPVSSKLTFLPDLEVTSVTPKTAVSISGARSAKAKFSMQVRNNRNTRFNGRLAAYLTEEAPEISHYFAVLAAKRLSLNPHETRQVVMELPQTSVTFKDESETSTLRFPYEAVFRAQDEAPKGSPRWTDAGESYKVIVATADAHVAPNLSVGYVRGFDYSLPDALASLGVDFKELSVNEVKTAELSKYNAIIVDNRAYELRPELISANQRLLDYAKDGGTLIVFYHKSNEWNPDERRKRPQLAPYSLVLGDERITDENAPITFLEPQHPLLNFPNKIGQEDFAGWIQERGLYYPKEWDSHYMALLASNDPGEQPLRGGLLVTDYGRGHYIYTSMVWYRQLRAGVPGAYRMLANMISYGRPTN